MNLGCKGRKGGVVLSMAIGSAFGIEQRWVIEKLAIEN